MQYISIILNLKVLFQIDLYILIDIIVFSFVLMYFSTICQDYYSESVYQTVNSIPPTKMRTEFCAP